MDHECLRHLTIAGIEKHDAYRLRRIAMQLHRWFEKECGVNGGCIERDETTGKPLWRNAMTGKAYPARDMETSALKRLDAIMAKYPDHKSYVQSDPRGTALYILSPRTLEFIGDRPIESMYSRGIAVYK